MEILKVDSKRRRREFLDVPKILYKDDPVWVCPLDKGIERIFDPDENTYFSHGEVDRWILVDTSGKLIGRIAAFIDYKSSKLQEQPTGGVGFFECIDDQEAAIKDLVF